MNKIITILLVLLSFSCAKDKQETSITSMNTIKLEESKKAKTTTTITNDVLTINDELYTLQFKIEEDANKKPKLIIDIKLHKGSHYISPFEEKEFSGKFFMDLGDYNNLSFNGGITETPQAVAIHDVFGNAPVIWVKENTRYTQPLNLKTKEDFEVFGRVIFTIEPRCSLEQIPFAISYKNGKFVFIDPKC